METVTDLLNSIHFHQNQSELSRSLKISRNTLRKYMADLEGEYHQIRMVNGVWQLLVSTRNNNQTC